MTGHAILEVSGLSVDLGGASVLGIDTLHVRQGETLALVGPNGAGKSTLLMCLAGLLKPAGGEVRYRGRNIRGDDFSLAYRRKIAMVFQEALLLDTTVEKNVATGLAIRGVHGDAAERIVSECLERFRIGHLRHRRALGLSGGESQRVSLARSFSVAPEILFMDEPFSALDPPAREGILEDLRDSLEKTRATVVFATHDRGEALALADRVLVLREGRIIQCDTPEAVMNRPVDEFVASFVGMETVLSGVAGRQERGCLPVVVNGVELETVGSANPGQTVLLGIRPENVTLLADFPAGGSSARNHFRARVERITPHDPLFKIQLDCGFPLRAFITGRSLENLGLRENSTVVASLKASGIHLIRKSGAS